MCLSLTCVGLCFIQMEKQRACDGFSGSVHLAWIAKYNLKLFWLHHDEVCLCCPMRSSTHVLYHIGHVLGLGQSEHKKPRWNEGRKLVSNTHSTMTVISGQKKSRTTRVSYDTARMLGLEQSERKETVMEGKKICF